MTYSTLQFQPILERPIFDGINKIYSFENNYGASVIRHSGSYGGSDGLWELAVIEFNPDGSWTGLYQHQITGGIDVAGWLEWNEVEDLLTQISKL